MISLDPIFNDLSTKPLATTPFEADSRMTDLLTLLAKAPSHGLGGGLRIPEEFYLTEIAHGFRLLEWLDSTSHDLREFFLTLTTTSPFLRGSPDALQERAKLKDYSIHGERSQALQAAHLMELPLVSFNHDYWGRSVLEAAFEEIDENGELKSGNVSLINLSECGHFQNHAKWIQERKKKILRNPAMLWDRRQELFPNLDFCPDTEDELLQFPEKGELFPQIVNRLFEMQRVAALLQPFNKDAFQNECKPSSESTLTKYADEYTFKMLDGDSIICHWHFNLPAGNRIYFGVHGNVYVIGHIGKHLKTVRFN